MRALCAGIDCLRVHRTAAKSGKEAEVPEDAQEIFGDALCRITNEAHAAIFEIA